MIRIRYYPHTTHVPQLEWLEHSPPAPFVLDYLEVRLAAYERSMRAACAGEARLEEVVADAKADARGQALAAIHAQREGAWS